MNKELYNFQKLTPINDAELNVYKDALDFVFDNPDLKNVGVSGAYSAGKSSVIETYKKLRPDIKFMHISLACFKAASESDTQPTQQSESVLEGKILNQLIHQINPTKIPQTNFRVKHQLPKKKLWLSTILVSLSTFLLIYLFNLDNWVDFTSHPTVAFLKNILEFTTNPFTAFLAGIICGGTFLYFVYEVFKMQFNKNLFKGISIQGNTIEIFEQNEESYFDKYLNEVLYLFENSDMDVIVFEDMDRYNTNQIFQRLREINTLVNSGKNDTGKPLRFFYLIRDDIFVSKERTKFFDFIMPVVPILDGSNSFDQFIAHFKKGNIYHLFNERFLQDVSLYIDDMRILKNIYNEFLVYYKRISTTGQDPNKLLAIIIYKNVFPRDFSELQLNYGYVHALFNNKEEFIKDEILRLNDEIAQISNAITVAENEHLKSVEEVNAIYDPKIQSLINRNSSHPQINVLNEEKNARLENLTNREPEHKNALRQQIIDRESDVSKLKHKKLHEIINKQNAAGIFKITSKNQTDKDSNFNDVKSSNYFPLIKYLIRNGYIDETYPDYMTYFYEHSLSRIDKIFLRSVTDEDSKDYSYQLKDSAMVLARLSEVSFEEEEILNFDLLSYLLDNQNTANESKLEKMLQQLKANKNFKFLDLYFKSGKPVAGFVQALNNIWPAAFGTILSESNFTEETKKQYALESLYHTDDAVLEKVNLAKPLSAFVSAHKDFLNIDNPNIERLVSAFGLLNVKFEDIDYTISDKPLFQAVYQYNFYIISFNLVCLMLKEIYHCHEGVDLRHKNYTVVLSKPGEPLVAYLEENINDYIAEVLNHCSGEISDAEESVIKLLNNTKLDIELKMKYINKLTTSIQCLSDINEVLLWPELLECSLVAYSDNNVLQYFFHSGNGLDALIAQFINEKATSVQFNDDTIDSKFGKGSGSKFYNAVVKNEFLNVELYAQTLKSLNRVYDIFSIKGISEPKMDVLIAQGIIKMTKGSLLFMREHYVDKVIQFVKHNIKKYVEEVMSDEIFALDEMIMILESDVADKYKLSLLQFTSQPLLAMVDAYSDKVKLHILKNNFDSNDIPELLKKYPLLKGQIQSIVEDVAVTYIESVIVNEFFVPFQLCKKLFALDSISTDNKLQLFTIALSNFSEPECKECLLILNRNDILSAFFGKRPMVPIEDANRNILDAMVKKHWIAGYNIDKKERSMYRISSRRVKNGKKVTGSAR